jgi:hypothetical protein
LDRRDADEAALVSMPTFIVGILMGQQKVRMMAILAIIPTSKEII